MDRTVLIAALAVVLTTLVAYTVDTAVLRPTPEGYALEVLVSTSVVAAIVLVAVRTDP